RASRSHSTGRHHEPSTRCDRACGPGSSLCSSWLCAGSDVHRRHAPVNTPAAMTNALRRLTIYEPFRSIFYAPQFVALHGGHFAGEGLDVQVETAGRGVTTTGALIDGHAEIALGGIMRSLDVADRGGPSPLHLAAVNQRP